MQFSSYLSQSLFLTVHAEQSNSYCRGRHAFRRFAEKIRLAQLEKNHRRREAGVKRVSIEGQYGRMEKSDEIQFVDAYVSASVKIATQASRASR